MYSLYSNSQQAFATEMHYYSILMYSSVWQVTKNFGTHDLNVKKETENYVRNWKLFLIRKICYLLWFIYKHGQQLSYVTLSDQIMSKQLNWKYVKINHCCLIMRQYPRIFVDGLNKTTNIREHIWAPGWDLNLKPHEYETKLPHTWTWYPVI